MAATAGGALASHPATSFIPLVSFKPTGQVELAHFIILPLALLPEPHCLPGGQEGELYPLIRAGSTGQSCPLDSILAG